MNRPSLASALVGVAATLALAGCASQTTQDVPQAGVATGNVACHMSFSLTGWAAIVKHASGKGLITCNDGTSSPITIEAHGGGLTVGKFRIDDGHGNFTSVHSINEVFGKYIQGTAHAGAAWSAHAQVLSKGTVSLALAGTGTGVGLGVAVGVFDIEPVGSH